MRYAHGVNGQFSYGMEPTPYTKAVDPTTYFGYLEDDFDPVNGENPLTPLGGGGTRRRGPYNYARDQKDYAFTVPVTVFDHNLPLETAFGERTITDVLDASLVKVADRHRFTETPTLPTMTVMHGHTDLDFLEWWIGVKSSLKISLSNGERVKADLDLVGARYELDDESPTIPDVSPPDDKSPIEFVDLADVYYGAKQIATMNSGDFGWDNGLAGQFHGTREAYAIAENTAKGKYDMKFNWNIVDLDLMKAAKNNAAPQPMTFNMIRGYADDGTPIDGMIVTLLNSRVGKAPTPFRSEGILEGEVVLHPTNSYIDILTPVVV